MLRLIIGFATLAIVLGHPITVHASGYLPRIEIKTTFGNHRACLAEMTRAYREQSAQQSARTVAGDGATREVSFASSTNGIAIIKAKTANYVGRVWYHNGRQNETIGQMEVSHTWEEIVMRCDGKTLTSGGANGYTLSTFEPISAEK